MLLEFKQLPGRDAESVRKFFDHINRYFARLLAFEHLNVFVAYSGALGKLFLSKFMLAAHVDQAPCKLLAYMDFHHENYHNLSFRSVTPTLVGVIILNPKGFWC